MPPETSWRFSRLARVERRGPRMPESFLLKAREETLTLVYGARDREHNDAIALAEVLRKGEHPR